MQYHARARVITYIHTYTDARAPTSYNKHMRVCAYITEGHRK